MRNSNYLWSVSLLLMTASGTHGFVATLDGQRERGGNRYLWCPASLIGGPWNSHTSHIYSEVGFRSGDAEAPGLAGSQGGSGRTERKGAVCARATSLSSEIGVCRTCALARCHGNCAQTRHAGQCLH